MGSSRKKPQRRSSDLMGIYRNKYPVFVALIQRICCKTGKIEIAYRLVPSMLPFTVGARDMMGLDF